MRIKYLSALILFFIAIVCTQQAIAQTPSAEQMRNVPIDQIPDAKIISMWQQARGAGYTESEIYSRLAKEGMQASQVQALKDRVTLLGLGNKPNNSGANQPLNGNRRIDYTRRQNDTVITPNSNRSNNRLSTERVPNRRNETPESLQNTRRENTLNGQRSSTYQGNQRSEQSRQDNDNTTDRTNNDYDPQRDNQVQNDDNLDDLLRSYRLLPRKLEIYGLNIFKNKELTFEPNFSVATPANYILGPGDEVIILLTGLNESSVTTTVSPEGKLQIPHAELLHVSGFTIEQTTRLVKLKMAKIYPALSSGRTQLALNLGNPRSIKVTVIGEANLPGTYTLSALASPFNILYNAGGPNENGTLRSIQLIRNNKLYKTLDFYSFLQNGLSDNIRLEDQDVLNITVYKKRIGIKGEIKRPALYELTEGETLADLIKYAGGYTPQAYQGVVKVDQINDLQHQVKDVASNMLANYLPNSGDVVEITEVSSRYTNRITLEGSVYQPGTYELTAGLTLSELLKKAQGLKPEAYTERGIINRTLTNLEKIAIPFKPIDVLGGMGDVPLMREDSVVIFDRSAFITEQKVVVDGYVRKPVIITYRKGLTLADAIAQAGGFDVEAAAHHVEISRIIKNQSDVVATQLVNTFVVDMASDSAKINGEKELQAMDVVYVHRLVNYKPIGDIVVSGEVVFPGKYSVQRRDETATEFLKRAGGLTPDGSLQNVQVFREGTRVSVDMASTNQNITNKLILFPGDSIYVPRVISYVEVAGAVNNPQFINYKGRRFSYYIDAAAGITEDARLKGAYISYPNGLSRPVKNFLFFRTHPPVLPGSKIYVPLKNSDLKSRISVAEIGGLATALTAIVSLIAILSR